MVLPPVLPVLLILLILLLLLMRLLVRMLLTLAVRVLAVAIVRRRVVGRAGMPTAAAAAATEALSLGSS